MMLQYLALYSRFRDTVRAMHILRKILVVASIGISLLVLFITGWLILGLSINAYPVGALLFLPWAFGLIGVVGLLRSWTPAPPASRACRL